MPAGPFSNLTSIHKKADLMTDILKDKAIIITGSSSGIGLAIARAVAAAGGHVLLHGTRGRELEAIAESFKGGARWVTADLADPNSPEVIAKAALDACLFHDGETYCHRCFDGRHRSDSPGP